MIQRFSSKGKTGRKEDDHRQGPSLPAKVVSENRISVSPVAPMTNTWWNRSFSATKKGHSPADCRRGRKGDSELADGELSTAGWKSANFSPPSRLKLLKFLEERILSVGGREKKSVSNVLRIIAATNRSLEQEIKAGNFREDLYYRLNIAKISLPPLRDRKEDIIPIALFFHEQIQHKAPARILLRYPKKRRRY